MAYEQYINVASPLHAATKDGKLADAQEIFLKGDQHNVQEVADDVEKLKNLNGPSRTEFEDLKTQTEQKFTEVNDSIATEISERKSSDATIQNSLDEYKVSNDQEISDLKSKDQSQDTTISNLDKKVNQNKTDVDNAISTVSNNLDEYKTSNDSEIEKLKSKDQSQDSTISTLEDKVDQNKSDLTESINELESNFNTHVTANNQKFSEIDSKNSEQDTATNKVANDLSTYQTSNDSEIEKLKAKDQSQDTTISNLDKKVNQNKSDLTDSINELESNFNTHVSASNQKFTELDQKNLDQDARLTALENKIVFPQVQFEIKSDLVNMVNHFDYSIANSGLTLKLLKETTEVINATSPIESNVENFKLQVYRDTNLLWELSENRYLCYWGYLSNPTMEDTFIRYLTPFISDDLIKSINATTDGEYMWILVPSRFEINKIMHRGFEFTLLNPVKIMTSLGEFNCYRSTNLLTNATWLLTISYK